MTVQAEVSLFPLRQGNNLNVKAGSMSSVISGDSQTVFQALQKAFEHAAKKYEVVLTVKISNACPEIK